MDQIVLIRIEVDPTFKVLASLLYVSFSIRSTVSTIAADAVHDLFRRTYALQ